MDLLLTADFWLAVGQIIAIDILLGGDNAVVIALACRRLPPAQRTQGILWGTAGAIVLRIVLIFFALALLGIPLLKVGGAILLLWIGIKLLAPEHEDGHAKIEGSDKLWGAVKTVIVADFVMSVDNVIAIAGAAESAGEGQHSMLLVIFGVLVSIPIIVWGSQLVIKLMDRFPIIITAGGMLLGWIAGTMLVTDPALANPEVMPAWPKLPASDGLRYTAGVAGALLVLVLGRLLAARAAVPATAAATPAASGTALRRVLVAVDGSEGAGRALSHLLAMRAALRQPDAMQVHLLNVQHPVPGDVSTFISSGSLQDYHHEKSLAALAPAQAQLRAAGVAHESHERVGAPAAVIAEVARGLGCDLVVMGTRGLGGPAAALLGSVARDTAALCAMPVLMVR